DLSGHVQTNARTGLSPNLPCTSGTEAFKPQARIIIPSKSVTHPLRKIHIWSVHMRRLRLLVLLGVVLAVGVTAQAKTKNTASTPDQKQEQNSKDQASNNDGHRKHWWSLPHLHHKNADAKQKTNAKQKTDARRQNSADSRGHSQIHRSYTPSPHNNGIAEAGYKTGCCQPQQQNGAPHLLGRRS